MLERGMPHVKFGMYIFRATAKWPTLKIDENLRSLTLQMIEGTTKLFANHATPTASYEKGRCDNCSLIDLCMPHALRLKRGAKSWFNQHLSIES